MKVVFSKQFLKDLHKAPLSIQESFEVRLEIFLKNPFQPLLRNHPLNGKFFLYRSMNVAGDWRAIFRFIEKDTIFFVALGTHSELYQ